MRLSKLFRNFVAVAMLYVTSFQPMTGQNYVKTKTYLDENEQNCITEFQFSDGLGRKSALASNGRGTSGNYVYTLQTYDAQGREFELWRPVIGTQTASCPSRSDMNGMALSTYNAQTAKSETSYDVLDRPTDIWGPGEVWRTAGKRTQRSYRVSSSAAIQRYKASMPDNSLQKSGSYPPGSLTIEEVSDEDGHLSLIYKDMLGNTVLDRRFSSADTLDTYYVYNDLNQLCYVLTPEYQKHPHKELFAYEYRYDDHGRLEKKILPQCGVEQNYYDSEGRIIYSSNALGHHYYYLYDTYGRQVVKGRCSNFNYHHYQDVSMQQDEDGLYGTGYVFPKIYLTGDSPIEVVYYDDYQFLTKSKFASSPYCSALTRASHASAVGLQTGSLVCTSSGKYVLTAIYYDTKGRVIDRRETLVDGGVKSTSTIYSFTDKPVVVSCVLTRNGVTTQMSKLYSYYDTNDQLQSVKLYFNGHAPVTVAEYEYDDLGQLQTLHRGGSAGDVSYAYNLRGMTTSIDGKGFKEWLHYTDGVGTPCYNGSISSILWQTGDEDFKRGYKFSYDGAGRMLNADYGEGDNLTSHANRYSEKILEYTLNGGIRKLERYGKKTNGSYGKIDNLRMYYTGMQVDSVKEDAAPLTYTGAFDFVSKTVPVSGPHYAYYDDGSLKWDANKGISQIEYDRYGNYPKRIQFSNGNVTEYEYTATGQKLRTIYRTAVPNITVPIGSTLTLNASNTLAVDTITYIGDFILENGQLSKCLFDNGYVTIANGQPVYHYFTRDHLGNNRAVVNHDGTVEQTVHYYPFGAIYSDAGTDDALQPYKYNGKELDRMHGLNQYDYGARNYDPLLCRFTQLDPEAENYYETSPYTYCADNPVNAIDIDGRYIYYDQPIVQNGKVTGFHRYKYDRYGDIYGFGDNGKLYTGSSITMTAISTALNTLANGGSYGGSIVSFLAGKNSTDVVIKYGGENVTIYPLYNKKDVVINWNLLDWEGAGVDVKKNIITPPFVTLGHELIHAADYISGMNIDRTPWFYLPKGKEVQKVELDTSFRENILRMENGLDLRKYYAIYKDSNVGYTPSLIPNFWW